MLQIVNSRIGSLASRTFWANNAGCVALPYLQHRSITSKKFRVKKKKPAPFPYEDWWYNRFWSVFDQTYKRFDENTRLIVIDGPIASGKHQLAKELAKEFEMKYVPDVTMDDDYVNEYGYDLRNLNARLPDSCHTFDEKDFCRDPYHIHAAAFNGIMYRLRWTQYWKTIEHLLHTGDGVVTVRSPFSAGVFTNAMRRCNYMSEAAKFYCNEAVRHTIFYLFRPHLIVYLDVPVEKTLENIKRRNRDHEVNGKALTAEYLGYIEDGYKSVYLRESSIHSKVLHYDWSYGGDAEIVVEDIERLDFEKYLDEELDVPKLCDWRLTEENMNVERYKFSCQLYSHLQVFSNLCIYDAPEMLVPGDDVEIFDKVLFSAPGMKYAKGYNPDQGDNVWFKTKTYRSRNSYLP